MKNVPVIMYHSVGYPNKNWVWSNLTCPVDVFEKQMRSLFKNRFKTIGLQELYDYMSYGKTLPSKAIVLTFDDGYLDNWVYVYPLLKKYGLRGTIYVNPEFVDPTVEYRPNLEDVWSGKVSKNELGNLGFLSWNEMKIMDEDGVMDIQSHALTHTWYFNSSRIIDFRNPWDTYIWVDWNEYPEKKPYYLTEIYPKKYGAPVYTYGKSLITKRYFPDIHLEKETIRYVKENGGKSFFLCSEWKNKLFKVVENYKKTHYLVDHIENEKEYERRVKHELLYSKEKIEKKLKKKVNFLCWPGGGVNETTLRLASEAGYLSSTYSSREKGEKNIFGEDPTRIKRISDLHFSRGPQTVHVNGAMYIFWLIAYSYSPLLSTALCLPWYFSFDILFRVKNTLLGKRS